MKGNSFSYVVLSLCLMALVNCEFYSSMHEVAKLTDYERFLLGKMEKFVTLNENKLDFLKEKLSEFERERNDSLDGGDEYFENPINKYLLTKRLTLDWERLENFLDHDVGTSTLSSIDRFRQNWTFPTADEVNGAIEGILRLQRIYRLDTKDIAAGILGGVKHTYSTELSAKDCFDFGNRAVIELNLAAAQAWYSEALDRFDSYEPTEIDAKFEKPDILEPLAETKFKLGDYNGAAKMSYALSLWRPYDTRLYDLYNFYMEYAQTRPSVEIEIEHEPIPADLDKVDEFTAYRLTCSGHIHQPPSYDSKLYCGYLTETHPFLLLAPIKVEEIHLEPMLVVFHDVIYDSEIEKVIELANDKIERAQVIGFNGSYVSPVRTSQYAFFPKETHQVLQTIDQRVADMTGLNLDVAEQHQVSNYGIGGHYAQHFDFFEDMKQVTSDPHLGNRIATVLFYLTDVEQGGGTAFPLMKRHLMPKKGSAAFWHNLHANGDGDILSRHGACPVLAGSKWVLNRWIRERGQEFHRPCELFDDSLGYGLPMTDRYTTPNVNQ